MKEAKVLVVIDTQNDFATGSLGTKEAVATIPNIVEIINLCGNTDYLILNTKDSHGYDYLDTTEGKNLPVPHTILGTEGWDTVPAIAKALNQYGSTEVAKNTFGSSDLAPMIKLLASQKIKKIITTGKELSIMLVGWCTDICVITNALLLKTAFPDADIAVRANCCAGVTPEKHEAALTVMNSCQISII